MGCLPFAFCRSRVRYWAKVEPLCDCVQETAEARQRRKETGRVEALSDGIFAIAMTLLVLEIQVPEVTNDESLVRALVDDWPSHLAFLIGFFTLLVAGSTITTCSNSLTGAMASCSC